MMNDFRTKIGDGLLPDGTLIRACEVTFRYIKEQEDRIEKQQRALRKIETLELDPRNSGQMWVEALRQIARAALEKKDD